MTKLLDALGLMVGGWIGWIVGFRFSILAGYTASVLGMGLGLYAARRLNQSLLP